jgi:hypothetical protein
MLNRPTAQPQFDQLAMRHGPVLPVGQLAKESIGRARSHFDSYVMSK